MSAGSTDSAKRNGEFVIRRWSSVAPFLYVGSASIVAGGLVAAVTAPLELDKGSWLAAYLVLVGGVAQISLGLGEAFLANEAPKREQTAGQLATWNLANLIVVVSSLAGSSAGTSIGGVILALSLVLFIFSVKDPAPNRPRLALFAYRGLAAFVLLSVPVGLALSWIRHG